MKYALLIFVQLLFINCVSNNSSEKLPDIKAYYISVTGCKTHESNKGCAYFKLDNNHFDFGVISRKKNPRVTIEVGFTNTGKAPLLIIKADVSCGCLHVKYPHSLLQPNETGKLEIFVDTRAQEGAFDKSIIFKTNAENVVEIVRIKGMIKK